MKPKNNNRSARVSSKKVIIRNHAKGLTSQAGLVPVVKFLRKVGMIGLIKETVDHKRGANALYDSADAVFPKKMLIAKRMKRWFLLGRKVNFASKHL